jgi:ABC-type transport system substrate-binding protein
MRSMRTTFRALGLVTATSALAAIATPLGCDGSLAPPIAGGQTPETSPRRGGTLHLAWFQDVRNLDPAGPTDGYALQAQHLMFAGLVDFDDLGNLVPELADHFGVEDGGRTYRFFLRAGVQMHDGGELTADDVKRSAERALHPTTPNPNANYFRNIEGYEAYSAGGAEHLSGISVEGRYVVCFRLSEPDATFLAVLALHTLRPVCRTAGQRYVDTWLPCGAGPFKLAPGGWQRGLGLRLVRHDGYFRAGLPYLDSVEWTPNMQITAQRFRFEDGKLDILRDMSQPDQARFAADPRWASLGVVEADRAVFGESMNTRMPPFDNVEVRRAVAAAVDREHYRALKPAYMTVLTQLVPPGVSAQDVSVDGQRYDVAAALDHMRRAGYPFDAATGKGGWPKPITYPLYDQGLVVYTAQLLQQDLAKIGLRLELKLMSWPAFLAVQQRPGGAALSLGNWEMDYPDPSSLFDPFTTAAIGTESTYNTSFYSNPRFDDLVRRARRTVDGRERAAVYRDANALLCDESPWAFAYAYHFYDIRQPYVRGFKRHPVWTMDVSRVWIDRAERGLARPLGRPLP